jgi:hypothetical protein
LLLILLCIVQREVLCVRELCIVKIFSWVRRSTLQLGAGRGDREERERDMQAKSVDRTVCFHIIYQETQFCGCSPRERVNHIYLVVCVIDVVFFFFLLYCYCIIVLDLRYNLRSRFKGDKE